MSIQPNQAEGEIPQWAQALSEGRLCDPFPPPPDPTIPGDTGWEEDEWDYPAVTFEAICRRRPWSTQLMLAGWKNLCSPIAVTMVHLARCAATLPGPLVKLSFGYDEETVTGFAVYLLVAGTPGSRKGQVVKVGTRQSPLPVLEPPRLLDKSELTKQGLQDNPPHEPWLDGWWGLCAHHPIALSTGPGLVAAYCDYDPAAKSSAQRRWCRTAHLDEAKNIAGKTAQDHMLTDVLRSMFNEGSSGQDNATRELRRHVHEAALAVILEGQDTTAAAGQILDEDHNTAHGTRERFLVARAADNTRPGPDGLGQLPAHGKITFKPTIKHGTIMRPVPAIVDLAVEVMDQLGRKPPVLPAWYQLIDHGQHTMTMLMRLAAIIALHDRPDTIHHEITDPDLRLAAVLMRASRIARDETDEAIRAATKAEAVDRARAAGASQAISVTTRTGAQDERLQALRRDYDAKWIGWLRRQAAEGRTYTKRQAQQYGPRSTIEQRKIEGHRDSRLKGLTIAGLIAKGKVRLTDDKHLEVTDD